MKTGMELVKEIRARQEACSGDLEEPLAALAHDCWKQCADELEAWLGERHRELDKAEASQGPDPIGPLYGAAISASRKWIRQELLGTTQEGE